MVLSESQLAFFSAPFSGAISHDVVRRGLAVTCGTSIVGDHPVRAVAFTLEDRAAGACLTLVLVEGIACRAESFAV